VDMTVSLLKSAVSYRPGAVRCGETFDVL
jgi:hypothetical protein